MTQEEQARRFGKTVRTLQQWRKNGYGPAYMKIGSGVFYREDAEVEFLTAQEKGAGAMSNDPAGAKSMHGEEPAVVAMATRQARPDASAARSSKEELGGLPPLRRGIT
jgi:hypothetical protein